LTKAPSKSTRTGSVNAMSTDQQGCIRTVAARSASSVAQVSPLMPAPMTAIHGCTSFVGTRMNV